MYLLWLCWIDGAIKTAAMDCKLKKRASRMALIFLLLLYSQNAGAQGASTNKQEDDVVDADFEEVNDEKQSS